MPHPQGSASVAPHLWNPVASARSRFCKETTTFEVKKLDSLKSEPPGVRQAFARLKKRPGAYATVGAREESKRIILQMWPDAIICGASAELNEADLKDLLNRSPRSKKCLVAGTECEPCFLLTTACLIQKIASTLRQAMPEFNVETLLESRNSLSNAKWMSVSKLYQMKPIAFRCSTDS